VSHREEFEKYYVNSAEQQRLSLTCLNTVRYFVIDAKVLQILLQVYVSSVSFNGSGRLEFNRVFPAIPEGEDLSNMNFNSFSLKFTTYQSTTNLFHVKAKVSSYHHGSD